MGRRHADALPAMRHHRRSGNARVRIGGIEHWLGPWASADARLRYDELIAAWIASGRKSVEAAAPTPPPAPAIPEPVKVPTSADVTVGELVRAWITSIERERGGAHKRASNWNGAIAAARALRPVAAMPARDFGPRALQDVRRRLVDTPFLRKRRLPDGGESFDAIPRSRRYVNDTVGRIRQLFNWAVGLELIPPERAYALSRVRALPLGQGRETARRTEVTPEVVEATLPHLTDEARALVLFIRWTACRPSEAARLRMCDVHDRDRAIWRYRPPMHKTAHRGQFRDVPIGPQARAILERHAEGRAAEDYVFDPRRSLARVVGNGPTITTTAGLGVLFRIARDVGGLIGLEFEARLHDDELGRRILAAGTAGLGVSIGYVTKRQWHVERDGIGTVRVVDDAILDHVAVLPGSTTQRAAFTAARCYAGMGRWFACPVDLHTRAQLDAYAVLKRQAGVRE